MYAPSTLYNSTYVPSPYRMAAPPAAAPQADPIAAPAPAPVFGQDVFVPTAAYAATAYPAPTYAAPAYPAPAYSPPVAPPSAPYPAPSAPTPYPTPPAAAHTPALYPASPAATPPPASGFKILSLEDIPGTPERMKRLTKQQMAPYFESIAQILRRDPEVSMAVTFGVYSEAQKLRLIERVKELVSGVYNLPPIRTQILDEPWVGGGYSFDENYLYSITTALLNDATAGDLVYLTVHEMTHAFQHRMVSLPIRPGGDFGELVDTWRGNTPQSHGYISYTGIENFELYAEQPLEFAAFLAGNFAEYQLTGGNNRLWGTSETEAWDLYA